ncbi:MAG: TlpA family protein disulfide reductase, partial [Microthrixaceae bacterium]|nr:TlpA family protein disulfide reductase [Microthrixaceae bacterium]
LVLLGILGLGIVAVVVAALTQSDPVEGQVQDVTVSGTALTALPEGGDDPAVGAAAPEIEGFTFTGEPVTIGGAGGQPTLIAFVAHWCPHCQAEVPRLVEWRADGTIPEDVRLVAVATSTEDNQPNYPPQDWLEGEDWPGDVMADSADDEAAAAYGVTSFPFFVALDADGNVVARGSGELDQQGIEEL